MKQHSSEKAPTMLSTTAMWIEFTMIWLFHALLFVTPLFFSFKTDELFEFNKLILVYFFGISLFFLWLARMVVERKILWKQHWFSWFIIAFLISQIVSTIFSIHPYTSLLGYYTRFHGGLLSYLTYAFLFWIAISTLSKKNLLSLLVTTLAGSIVVSIYAILEHFGHSFSCVLSTGQFGVDCWVQDVKSRVFATFGQPNWLAAYNLMLLPLALWLIAAAKAQLWHRALGMCALVGLIWSLLYTQSRSGFFGLLLALSIYGFGWLIAEFLRHRDLRKNPGRSGESSHNSSKWTLAGFGIIAFALIVSGASFVPAAMNIWKNVQPPSTTLVTQNDPTSNPTTPPPVVDRLTVGGTDSGEIRQIVWSGALAVWQRYPWFGSGTETFGYAYYQDRPVAHNLVSEWDFLYNKAHNEFLNFLATTGLIGLVTYVLLLAGGALVMLIGAVSAYKNRQFSAGLAHIALLAGFAGLTVSNFFGFSTVMVTTLQFLFWAASIILHSATSAKASAVNSHHKTDIVTGSQQLVWWQYLSLTIIAFLAFYSLFTLANYYQADLQYAAAKQSMQAGDLNKAIVHIDQAIKLSPVEALYWSELAEYLAQAALSTLASSPEDAEKYLEAAIQASNESIRLNPQQRNFYKSRARLFIIIGQLDPAWYSKAIDSLNTGMDLSPTDAKLLYNRGLLRLELGNVVEAKADFLKAVELKPNYEGALTELIRLEAAENKFQEAADWAKQGATYHPLNDGLVDAYASYSALATASSTIK